MSHNIALIYTGFLRTWDQCWKNHRDNIWTQQSFMWFYTYESPSFAMHEDKNEPEHPHRWTKIHEPFFPDPFGFHRYSERKAPENTVFNTWNQWINNLVGFIMTPPGFDIYVRIRPDIKFNGKLDFSQYDCSKKVIYIPQGHDFGGINDQFAFGNREVMKIYYSVFINCHDLWHEGVLHHSESMQLANLNKHGVEIVRINPQHDIIR